MQSLDDLEGTASCDLNSPPTHEVPNTELSRPGLSMPIRGKGVLQQISQTAEKDKKREQALVVSDQ